jgi:recombination protein RecA
VGSVFSSSLIQIGKYDVIPTGSIGIDYKVLGVGGFAKGKVYEMRGWEGSNKTTLCGHLTANAQKLEDKVLYIDSEHALDGQYFTQLGVDMDNVIISQPDWGEAGFEVALQMIRSGEIGLVIIDSDSSLIPKVIMEGEVGDATMGKKAKMNSDFYPKLKVATTRYNTCCVVVSQYREKIGMMFGDPKITQGGHALKFTADVVIELKKSLKKEGDETCGTITSFKTIKNKIFVPFKVCEFDTVFGKGIDRVVDTMNNGIDEGIIEKVGNTYSFDETKLGVGTGQLEKFLEDNPELMEIIRERIIDKLRIDSKDKMEAVA